MNSRIIIKIGLVLYAIFGCLGISGIQFSTGIIFIGMLYMLVRGEKFILYTEENKNVVIIFFLFVLWNLVVSIFGVVPKISIKKLIEFFGAYLVCLGIVNSDTDNNSSFIKKVIYLIILFCMIESFYGILQYFTGIDITHKIKLDTKRIRGTFGYYNSLGGVLGMMVPFIYANILYLPAQKVKEKIFLTISFVFSLVALILTFTRGAWAGVSISILVISFYKFRWKTFILFMLVPVLLIFAPVRERIKETINNPQAGREVIWQYSIELFKERPITGHGFFSFQEKVRKKDFYLAEYHFHSHNVYLNTMLQSGLIGVLLLIICFIYIFRYVVVKSKEMKDNGIILGIMGVIIDFYIHSFVDNVLWGETMYMFWFFIGIIFLFGRDMYKDFINLKF